MKKYLLFAIVVFSLFFISPEAAVLPKNSYYVKVADFDLPYKTGVSAGGYLRPSILLYNLAEATSDVQVPMNTKFNFLILDVCSSNLFTNDNVTIENTGTNAYFDSDSLLVYNTNMSCDIGDGYKGNLYKVQMQVGKYVDSQGDGLFAASYLKIINKYNYYTITIFKNSVLSDEDILTGLLQNNITNDLQRDILNQQKEFNKKQDETNKKLDDLNKNLVSDESPKLDALNNSAGWLPPGVLDSILNLPLSFLNNLFTSLSKSCHPVILPLPFVDKSLNLPCLSSIYSQIDGLNELINSISIIASVFILFTYLIHLYKWVDDTLSFRENNYINDWGGI